MADTTTPDLTAHGETSTPGDPDEGETPATDTEVQSLALQLSSQSLQPTQPRTFEITYFWEKVYSDNFTINDGYIFDHHAVSNTRMVHVLNFYHQFRMRRYAYLSSSDERSIISEICAALDSVHLLDELPTFNFFDSKIYIRCPNVEFLVKSFDIFRMKTLVSSYSMEIVSKGFPFRPTFWCFQGILSDLDEEALLADVRSYLTKHAAQFGKTRAVWAKFYEISSFPGKRAFAGNLLVLTEAQSITKDGEIPSFRGVRPERGETGYMS